MVDVTRTCERCGAGLTVCTDDIKALNQAIREFEDKHKDCKEKRHAT